MSAEMKAANLSGRLTDANYEYFWGKVSKKCSFWLLTGPYSRDRWKFEGNGKIVVNDTVCNRSASLNGFTHIWN